jgi:UDP-N-acetylmuramate: L-alanyl-gamma-D-glutamyl-meso-diaminopimelate ligase
VTSTAMTGQTGDKTPDSRPQLTQPKAHFIGVCGAGMSAVAHLMQKAGFEVSGSDEGFYPPVSDYVAKIGIITSEGYRPENIPADSARIIIGKNAKLVPQTNAEVAAAFALYAGKIRSFPEVVSEMAADTHNIVVAGSYGKSTVTSLIAFVLKHAGLDPSYLIGALPHGFDHTSDLGKGKFFVMEGDEYPSANWDNRSKFEHYRPNTVVLTAACHDHVNVFPTLADYHVPFERLMKLIEHDGLLVACIAESNARSFYENFKGRKRSYGIGVSDADWQAHDLTPGAVTSFTLSNDGAHLGKIETTLLGRHNVENILATAAVLLGDNIVTFKQFTAAILAFEGLTRRLDCKVPKASNIHVYEGFGSSHEKARSAIDAMRLHFPDSRLIVLFEPHTFTWRNRNALPQYQTAFADTDIVFAHRPPVQGAGTHDQASLDEILAEARQHHTDVRAFNSVAEVVNAAHAGDVVLILSSGNFDGLMQPVIKGLGEKGAA